MDKIYKTKWDAYIDLSKIQYITEITDGHFVIALQNESVKVQGNDVDRNDLINAWKKNKQ